MPPKAPLHVRVDKTKRGALIVATGPFVEPLVLRSHKLRLGADIQLEDGRVDEAFVVTGDEALALATLTPKLRAELVALSREGTVALEDGRFTLEVTSEHGLALTGVLCQRVGAAAEQLVASGGVRKRLRALANERPKLASRVAALLPSTQVTSEPRVGSIESLRMTAESSADVQQRISAIDEIVARTTGARAMRLLLQILVARMSPRGSALPTKDMRVLLVHLVRLSEAASKWPRRRQARELAEIMVEEGGSELKVAAARMLAHIGNASSLAPLAKGARGFFTPREVKRACAEAVAAIEKRIGDARHGAVSVAEEAEEGALSESDPDEPPSR